MTRAQEALLLTVARILRAKISDEICAAQAGDLQAIDVALAPFEPPFNAARTRPTQAEPGGGE